MIPYIDIIHTMNLVAMILSYYSSCATILVISVFWKFPFYIAAIHTQYHGIFYITIDSGFAIFLQPDIILQQ